MYAGSSLKLLVWIVHNPLLCTDSMQNWGFPLDNDVIECKGGSEIYIRALKRYKAIKSERKYQTFIHEYAK